MKGHRIKSIELIDDRILIGGAIGSCPTPSYWIFDMDGNLLDWERLDISFSFHFEEGWIEQISFLPELDRIIFLAHTQVASDVGGSSIFIWQYDKNHGLLSKRNLFGKGTNIVEGALYEDHISTVVNDTHRIYNLDYKIIYQEFLASSDPYSTHCLVTDSLILQHHYGNKQINRLTAKIGMVRRLITFK